MGIIVTLLLYYKKDGTRLGFRFSAPRRLAGGPLPKFVLTDETVTVCVQPIEETCHSVGCFAPANAPIAVYVQATEIGSLPGPCRS